MPGFETLKAMKKVLVPGVFAAALAALIGFHATGVAAQGDSQLWSVVVHFEYQDGTEYDYVIASGVPTSRMSSMLADCGRSHWTGTVVRYYCYPVPE